MGQRYHSWGRYPKPKQSAVRLSWRNEPLLLSSDQQLTCLPFGNGRSYGDSCLNEGGLLLDARGLDRFIAFDPSTGILRCEAGVLLAEILALVVPQGWFLPVIPGTQFVTVGGAIANDVHGKNHHRAGTFGCYVRCFELLRSDNQRLVCSPAENPDWFRATIGGLGLTGMILWAEIALKRILNPAMEVDTIRFPDLEEFFALSAESDRDFEYTVAWIDCLARDRYLGRGLFFRANHAAALCSRPPPAPKHRFNIALELPVSLINRLSVRAFNSLYYQKQRGSRSRAIVHYDRFFYPLDGIWHWNRLYGPRGFLQYQCVVPDAGGKDAVKDILHRVAAAGTGSSLAVLKVFGDQPSPGLLSFPRPGVTLALDFPYRGEKTLGLLEQLDQTVVAAGGAVYPAKDARMSAASFKQYFPRWETLEGFRDPKFSSSFWRRVTQE
jgi:FAD/FMN-containing dehydrogenase